MKNKRVMLSFIQNQCNVNLLCGPNTAVNLAMAIDTEETQANSPLYTMPYKRISQKLIF